MSRFKTFGRAVIRKVTDIAPIRAALRWFSLRGLLPEFIHHRLPVVRPFRLDTPSGKSFVYEPTSDDVVSRRAYWLGTFGFESETTRVFWDLAVRSSVFLDIGSNTGYFSLLATAANPDLRVYAFEPVPRIYQRLERHMKINGVADRCKLLNIAVADYAGRAKFHVPEQPVPTSASLNTEGFRGFAGVIVEVDVMTVDSVIPSDLRVDLVKLDVEGFEDKALLGMPRILGENQPALFVECLPDGPYEKVDEILRSYGYEVFHLLPTGPKKLDRVQPDVLDRYRNFLFLPPGRAGVILNNPADNAVPA